MGTFLADLHPHTAYGSNFGARRRVEQRRRDGNHLKVSPLLPILWESQMTMTSSVTLRRLFRPRELRSDTREWNHGWWAVINDVRTSLEQNPLPLEVVKQLLGEPA